MFATLQVSLPTLEPSAWQVLPHGSMTPDDGIHLNFCREQAAPDFSPIRPDRFSVRVRASADAVYHET
jgi:hypothetical protein